MEDNKMSEISWKVIDKYFTENPNNLVAHHLESYNDFFNGGINRIFRENNPIRFSERDDEGDKTEQKNECSLYLAGKDGSKIYFGKPIIYDEYRKHCKRYINKNKKYYNTHSRVKNVRKIACKIRRPGWRIMEC